MSLTSSGVIGSDEPEPIEVTSAVEASGPEVVETVRNEASEPELEPAGRECEMGWPSERRVHLLTTTIEKKTYQEPGVYGPHEQGQGHWHTPAQTTTAHARHAVFWSTAETLPRSSSSSSSWCSPCSWAVHHKESYGPCVGQGQDGDEEENEEAWWEESYGWARGWRLPLAHPCVQVAI